MNFCWKKNGENCWIRIWRSCCLRACWSPLSSLACRSVCSSPAGRTFPEGVGTVTTGTASAAAAAATPRNTPTTISLVRKPPSDEETRKSRCRGGLATWCIVYADDGRSNDGCRPAFRSESPIRLGDRGEGEWQSGGEDKEIMSSSKVSESGRMLHSYSGWISVALPRCHVFTLHRVVGYEWCLPGGRWVWIIGVWSHSSPPSSKNSAHL